MNGWHGGAFEPYVSELESLARMALDLGPLALVDQLPRLLDGDPSRVLLGSTTSAQRRAMGAFFTPGSIAMQVVDAVSDHPVLDPACGAGDLLLAAARHLPVEASTDETLSAWGCAIHGIDVEEVFIRAARARLVLLAVSKTGLPSAAGSNVSDQFPNLTVGDYLSHTGSARTIVLNPPFFRVPAPKDCDWSTGAVSAAALFAARAIEQAEVGTRLMAILPDVLRSGSRYAGWRAFVASKVADVDVRVLGRFASSADVDVFALRCVVDPGASGGISWTATSQSTMRRLADSFSVGVGPVVPHRHSGHSREAAYLPVANAPAWDEVATTNLPKRMFDGRLIRPPFVAVRRTSAPGDHQRAIATLVTGPSPVAVENHLLVLEPHARDKRRSCEQLIQSLRDPRTTAWLNRRIRCRHLTTQAMRELPLEHEQ
jgi:hypothetical protein